MAAFLQKFLAFLVIGICLVAIYFSTSWGLADYYDTVGYSEVETWRNKTVTAENWEFANKNISRAVELDPTNPKLRRRLARLYRDKVTQGVVDRSDQASWLVRSREELMKSLEFRPRHGDTWAELALVKYFLGEPDQEMAQAIHEAVTWAPWESTTNILLTDIGFYWFEYLSSETQLEVVGAVARGLRSPHRKPNVHQEVWTRLLPYPQHHHLIIQALEPTLVDAPWPKSTRSNFARLADWAWPELRESQKQELAVAAFETIKTTRQPDRLFALIKVDGLREAICQRAAEDGFSLAACG